MDKGLFMILRFGSIALSYKNGWFVNVGWYFPISVCSTTLWIGHLNKNTTDDDLAQELSKYAEIKEINVREIFAPMRIFHWNIFDLITKREALAIYLLYENFEMLVIL